MKDDATIRSQSYAVEIEYILCKIFNCNRFGIGGIANSDYIRRQPIPAMFCGLTFLLSANPAKKAMIEKFINEHMYYADMSIDYLLSFATNEKRDGTSTITINFDNGEKALQDIIEKYREVIE